tara:strand:+ start:184 stop:468 length:285 start_codon:yes stop_codon:yes gene_type:complete
MGSELPFGKSGPRNKEILKSFEKKIGTGELPKVKFMRDGKELDAIGIRDALKEEEEGRLIRKTSKMFKGGILNRTYGMKEGGFTKRGGMYKKGY